MTKGLCLDMIGSVQLDHNQHLKLFQNPAIDNFIVKLNRNDELAPDERKAKLLEYLT